MTSSVQERPPTGSSHPEDTSASRLLVPAATLVGMVLLFALLAACQQAPERADPYRLRIDEGELQGEITVEETTFRGTRVRGDLTALPPGLYEAYFSDDACQTRGKRQTGFGFRDVADVKFMLEDQDLAFSDLSTGAHYLGIESIPSDDGAPAVCLPLAP